MFARARRVIGHSDGRRAENSAGDALAPAFVAEEMLAETFRSHAGAQCNKSGDVALWLGFF
jgi:hypothetical protein